MAILGQIFFCLFMFPLSSGVPPSLGKLKKPCFSCFQAVLHCSAVFRSVTTENWVVAAFLTPQKENVFFGVGSRPNEFPSYGDIGPEFLLLLDTFKALWTWFQPLTSPKIVFFYPNIFFFVWWYFCVLFWSPSCGSTRETQGELPSKEKLVFSKILTAPHIRENQKKNGWLRKKRKRKNEKDNTKLFLKKK